MATNVDMIINLLNKVTELQLENEQLKADKQKLIRVVEYYANDNIGSSFNARQVLSEVKGNG